MAAALLAGLDGGIRSADLSFVYGGFHVYGHRHGIVAEGQPGYGEGRQVKYRGIQVGKVTIISHSGN